MLIIHRARGQIPSYFADVFTSVAEQGVKQSSSKPFNFDVAFTMDNISTIYRYLVHHTMTRSSGNKDLDLWARERKLFGWVAVAAPLEVSHNCFQLLLAWKSDKDLRVILVAQFATKLMLA